MWGLKCFRLNLLCMMAQGEIPEMLAEEATMCTESKEEAEKYVLERVDGIRLEWPDGFDW